MHRATVPMSTNISHRPTIQSAFAYVSLPCSSIAPQPLSQSLSPNLYSALVPGAFLPTRKTFSDDLRALTRYLYFENWDHLLTFMIEGLELEIPPKTS